MCGYCTESAILTSLTDNTVVESHPLEYIFKLQENENFIDVLNKMLENNNKSIEYCNRCINPLEIAYYRLVGSKYANGDIDILAIIYCRMLESLILKRQFDICKTLINKIGKVHLNNFIIKVAKKHNYNLLKSLENISLYTDENEWERFIENNKTNLINISMKVLNDYYNFWILGNGKEKSDPCERLETTGIMDPLEDTTPKDWEKFYLLFPIVYFSFVVLLTYKKDSDIIKNIALDIPHDVPDFIALDLWLQRKAFFICINKYGIQFFLDNYKNIRLELLYYVILKDGICMKDLLFLKDYFLSKQKYWITRIYDSINIDLILELIDNKLKNQKLI